MKRYHYQYEVNFWQSGCTGSRERFDTKRQAQRAIAEFIRDRLEQLPRLRRALVRSGSAYRDGAVTVFHKAGGREFGAYIDLWDSKL